MRALDAIRPAEMDGSEPVFGLSVASISRRVKQVAESAGLGPGFSGHSGRVGMARRMAAAGAPTHEIMTHGRWKTARMVEIYTRAEEAGRAAPQMHLEFFRTERRQYSGPQSLNHHTSQG